MLYPANVGLVFGFSHFCHKACGVVLDTIVCRKSPIYEKGRFTGQLKSRNYFFKSKKIRIPLTGQLVGLSTGPQFGIRYYNLIKQILDHFHGVMNVSGSNFCQPDQLVIHPAGSFALPGNIQVQGCPGS